MSKSMFPEIVKAPNPTTLFVEVMEKIQQGYDLYAPPFISTDNREIVQFVVRGTCLYEYRLVQAGDLTEFEGQVQGLAALGFDFMFSTLLWNGDYIQWMQRMNVLGTLGSAISVGKKDHESSQ